VTPKNRCKVFQSKVDNIQPFVEKAKADSERAAKDKEEYQKTLPPKRPLSAYILYSKEIRDSIVKAHPNASIGEQAKLMGEKWRNLSESQKDVRCLMRSS
jgi:hypothetical protein